MEFINTISIDKNLFKKIPLDKIALILTAIIILIYIGIKNYLLFHGIVELSSIIVAFSCMIIALGNHKISKNSFLIFIGIACSFVGCFDMVHTFAYKGMNILAGDTTNRATQFWIIARYMESISFLLAFLFINKSVKPKTLFIPYTVLSITLLLSVSYFDIFPDCYITGTGLTNFKIISEYLISLIFAASILLMNINKEKFSQNIYSFMISALYFKIASELSFTLYIDVMGLLNMIGHIFKFIACYFLYKALVKSMLDIPYELLNNLNEELRNNNIKLLSINEELKREISIREETEKALRESEERYRFIVELSPDAIFIRHKDKVVYANNAAARLSRVPSPKDIIGSKSGEIIGPHPSYKKVVQDRIDHVLNNGQEVPFLEQLLIRHDGSTVEAEVAVSPFQYKGQPSIMIIARDISARREIEKLQSHVAENDRLLNEALELDRLKTEFFCNISHEFKTPLNVILGTTQLFDLYMQTGIFSEEKDNLGKHIKVMKQNCYRLLRLINNIIDINKIDSGFMNLQLQNCNIVSTIEDMTLSVADYIQNKGINLIFDTDIEEKITACDIDKIERIILNLLSNAIKFTNPGGNINVSVYDGGESVLVSIKDDGAGIPEDKLGLIFERFRQVDRLFTRKHEGSGIGLSLVKSIVEMHGGKITVESSVGEGSEFIIELPVRRVQEESVISDKMYELMSQKCVEKISIEFSDIYSLMDTETCA